MDKTFIYYSPSNKEIVAIVAATSAQAKVLLIGIVAGNIIKDDYYLAASCNNEFGGSAIINLDIFDNLSK